MIKKVLVGLMLAAVVVACGDNKKKKEEQKPEAPKYASVECLAKSPDSLLNVAEATVVGRVKGVCPVCKAIVLEGRHGAKLQLKPADGVTIDSTFYGKFVAVSGKISAQTLDSTMVADMKAKMEECKANCPKDGKPEMKGDKDGKHRHHHRDMKDGKGPKGEKAEAAKDGEVKECPKGPQVGDKVYSMNITKIEVTPAPEGRGDKKCNKECDKKDGEPCCKDGKDKSTDKK